MLAIACDVLVSSFVVLAISSACLFAAWAIASPCLVRLCVVLATRSAWWFAARAIACDLFVRTIITSAISRACVFALRAMFSACFVRWFASLAISNACDDKLFPTPDMCTALPVRLFAVSALSSECLATSYVLTAHTPNTTAVISPAAWMAALTTSFHSNDDGFAEFRPPEFL